MNFIALWLKKWDDTSTSHSEGFRVHDLFSLKKYLGVEPANGGKPVVRVRLEKLNLCSGLWVQREGIAKAFPRGRLTGVKLFEDHLKKKQTLARAQGVMQKGRERKSKRKIRGEGS